MPTVTESSLPPPPPPAAPAAPEPETTPDGPVRTWGPTAVLAGVGLVILISIIGGTVVAIFDPDLKSVAAKLAVQAVLAGALIGVALAMVAQSGAASAREALGLRRPRDGYGRLIAVTILGYLAFALIYSTLVKTHQKDLTRDLGYGDSAIASVIAGVLIVLAAPISEEMFFRGFLFGGIRSRLPFIGAALISAAVFGAVHYTGGKSYTVLPQLAALGFAQAWLFERSGSIYPTIAVHIFNNALAFAVITQ